MREVMREGGHEDGREVKREGGHEGEREGGSPAPDGLGLEASSKAMDCARATQLGLRSGSDSRLRPTLPAALFACSFASLFASGSTSF